MTNITLAKLKHHAFGTFLEELALTTVFATDDNGRWFINPVIHEEDGDCVVFEQRGEGCAQVSSWVELSHSRLLHLKKPSRLHDNIVYTLLTTIATFAGLNPLEELVLNGAQVFVRSVALEHILFP